MRRSTLIAALVVATVLALSARVEAQGVPRGYEPAPPSSGVYVPPSAATNGVYVGESVPREPRTRANPVHWVGFALGAAGVAGGAVTLLLGAFVRGFGGDGQVFLITGGIILPVGGLAMLTAGILIATDRIVVDDDVALSFSLQPSWDGARGELRLSF